MLKNPSYVFCLISTIISGLVNPLQRHRYLPYKQIASCAAERCIRCCFSLHTSFSQSAVRLRIENRLTRAKMLYNTLMFTSHSFNWNKNPAKSVIKYVVNVQFKRECRQKRLLSLMVRRKC